MSLEESETECPDADHSGGSCIDILGVWNLFDLFWSRIKKIKNISSRFLFSAVSFSRNCFCQISRLVQFFVCC
jgi:hypothetical protein